MFAIDIIAFRCEKHIGRNPCIIDGCGSTFALKADEDYSYRFICGRHWREAPKWRRDRVAKLRKRAKRIGWTHKLCRIYSTAWDQTIQSILDRRRVSRGEVAFEPSAGPPPAALMKELEQLGL